MSATDDLRRMLDERGVEWRQSANTLGCIFTRWYSPIFGDEVVAMENGEEGLVLFDHFMTPEQAIEATLGRGECRLIPTRDKPRSKAPTLTCSKCGWWTDRINDCINYCPSCGRAVRA